jgi:hypothetical protein
MPRVLLAVFLAALQSYAGRASADSPLPSEPKATPGTLVPVFSIAKSENRNQVEYVVLVDDHCAPRGPTPVSAHWRMFERGPMATEPILPVEVAAYGLASESVIARDASGGQVRVVLRALTSRPLIVETSRGSDGACRALAHVSIAGAPANLFNVYVHLRWDGLDYLLLQGWSPDGSHVVREKLAK